MISDVSAGLLGQRAPLLTVAPATPVPLSFLMITAGPLQLLFPLVNLLFPGCLSLAVLVLSLGTTFSERAFPDHLKLDPL